MHRKNILWDLGNTLVRADTLSYARHIGLTDFLLYPLFTRENPQMIYTYAFEVLRGIDTPPHAGYPLATARGITLPQILCHALADSLTQEEIMHKVHITLNTLSSEGGTFVKRLRNRMVKQTIKILFDPAIMASCMKPIKNGVAILKECAQRDTGLYVLSNWDSVSFKLMKSDPLFRPLFEHFKDENIVISGTVGAIKPQAAIYEHFLQKQSLRPETCILIDDQLENIQRAEAIGMTGILVEGDYTAVRKKLQELHVL